MQSIEEGAHLLANHGEILEGERVVDVENDRVSLRIAARRLDRAKRTVGEGMRCIRFGGSGGGRGRRRGRVLRRGTARLEEGAQIDFFAVIVDFKLFRLEIRDCPPFFVEGNQWEVDEAGRKTKGDGGVGSGLGQCRSVGHTGCRSDGDLRHQRLRRSGSRKFGGRL